MKNVCSLLFLLAIISPLAAQQPETGTRLAPEKLALVRAACFEVVAQKPEKDSMTYEKPLNWDLQDFAVRNDRYIPLGTAFAISATEAITAAHVFDIAPASPIYTTRFIRERPSAAGGRPEVFEVQDVTAYSENRDYVVFTVKGKRFDHWLTVNRRFSLNTTVFTAGDAYGEGIVVRDGTLLDETPEPEDGAWKFLKSSASVNPGNSGGPLLDSAGSVIGVVLSHRDDFCYSLPVREITPGKAAFHKRMTFGFAVFARQKRMTLEQSWDLPLPYRALVDRYRAAYVEFYGRGMDALLAENSGDLFPAGANSAQALFEYVDGSFPQVYLQDSRNGTWFASVPEIQRANIGNDGVLSAAAAYKDSDVWLMRLKKPNGTSVQDLWDSPRAAMDLLLKGVGITRRLTDGDQGSRITSFGDPVQTVVFADRFGRNWQLNVFLVEYSDSFVMTCATPTPQGLSLVYVSRAAAHKEAWLYDVKKLTDFVNVSYYGTLEQWAAFPRSTAFAAGPMTGLSITYEDGAAVHVETGLVSAQIPEGLVHVSKDSDLYIGCSVFLKDGAAVWDVRKLLIDTGGGNDTDYFTFYRWTRPTDGLPEAQRNEWKSSVLEHRHPYTGNVFSDAGKATMGMLHPVFIKDGKVVIAKDFAYTLFASKEAPVSDEQMRGYLEALAQDMHIRE
jgi:serine protease Do